MTMAKGVRSLGEAQRVPMEENRGQGGPRVEPGLGDMQRSRVGKTLARVSAAGKAPTPSTKQLEGALPMFHF